MKKNLIISSIWALGINVACMLINLACGYFGHFLPFAYSYRGGEMTGAVGFGISLIKIYAMSEYPDGGSSSYRIEFEPISFIITLVITFVITFIIVSLIRREKNKK